MPKLEMDPPFRYFRGRVGGLVYRKDGDGTTAARFAAITTPPTAAQLAVREQFRAAAVYAKAMIADAVLGPRYAAAAKVAGQRPFAFAVADFLNEPVVRAIDAAGYHGGVGEPIMISASDDFEVTGVNVSIRDGDDAAIEEGAAVLVDGRWRYAASTAIPAGTAVVIEAVAKDRPGHTGTLRLPLVIA